MDERSRGDPWEDQARRHQEAAIKRKQGSREDSRERLAVNLEKKLMTATVGALAAMEDEFGYIWGEGVPPSNPQEPLSPDEQHFREMYQRVRERVFDNVNALIRGMRAELSLHEVEYVGRRVELRTGRGPSPNFSKPNQRPDQFNQKDGE